MPEEINRVLTDHISEMLFAPTVTAVKNLKAEGINNNVFNIGDVMFDIALEVKKRIENKKNDILNNYKLENKNYILATIHRADNTDNEHNLFNIMETLKTVCNRGYKIFFPVHPRTKRCLEHYGFLNDKLPKNLILNEPVSYSEMIVLESSAKVVLTDSGGVQKEAYFFKTPVVIPRNETEWIELVDSGWNILAGVEKEKIVDALLNLLHNGFDKKWENFYGNGDSSYKIVKLIDNFITK